MYIQFDRRELVWERYCFTMNEADYLDMVEHFKSSPFGQWREAYERLKDLPFEHVCRIFKGLEKDITWEEQWADRTYHCSLYDAIVDYMRDIAWENGPYDSYGADDSDEEVNTYGVEEEEAE